MSYEIISIMQASGDLEAVPVRGTLAPDTVVSARLFADAAARKDQHPLLFIPGGLPEGQLLQTKRQFRRSAGFETTDNNTERMRIG